MTLKLDGTGAITGIDQGLNIVGVVTYSTDLNVGGDLNVTGVLTYDDVTNVDSIGVVTARSGLQVTSGDVLIGTTSNGAGNRLYVVDNFTDTFVNPSDSVLRVENANTSGTTTQASISLTSKTSGSNADSAIVSQAEDASGNSSLQFWTDTSNGMSEKLRITGIGSVGIGTDDPKTVLHISDNTVANTRVTISKSDTFRNNFIGLDNQSDELVIAVDDDNQGPGSSLTLKVDGAAVGTFTGTGVSFAQDLTLPDQERFLAYKTGNQTENDNTSALVGFGAATYDTAGGWNDSNNRYVIQNSGFFLLTVNAAVTSSTSNELRDAAISIERSTDSGSNWTPIASSGMRANTTADTDGLTLNIVLPYNLNAGDWLRVGAYGNPDGGGSYIIEDSINHIMGGDINLSGSQGDYDNTTTYFSVVKLA